MRLFFSFYPIQSLLSIPPSSIICKSTRKKQSTTRKNNNINPISFVDIFILITRFSHIKSKMVQLWYYENRGTSCKKILDHVGYPSKILLFPYEGESYKISRAVGGLRIFEEMWYRCGFFSYVTDCWTYCSLASWKTVPDFRNSKAHLLMRKFHHTNYIF